MSDSNSTRRYRDPLLAELEQYRSERRHSPEPAADAPPSAPATSRRPIYLLAVLVLAAMGLLGYFLIRAQQHIDTLSSELSTNQNQLAAVTTDLVKSQERLEGLNQGLEDSRQRLSSQSRELKQYQGLYQGIRSDQERQTQELQVLHQQKADQAAVVALKDEAATLKGRIEETDGQVQAAKGDIAKLATRAEANQSAISETKEDLAAVRKDATKNASDIDGIRRSLEREYYNFELVSGSGYLKVFDLSLALKGTNVGKRQYDIYILAGGKVIQKKHQAINEPILFYTESSKKPYEVVVTRVDNKMVVGYLSVPKSTS